MDTITSHYLPFRTSKCGSTMNKVNEGRTQRGETGLEFLSLCEDRTTPQSRKRTGRTPGDRYQQHFYMTDEINKGRV